MATKPRKPKKSVITGEEFDRLFSEASKGNSTSEKQLERLTKTYAKRANERLRQLRKAGFRTAARTRAEDFISENFGEKRKNYPSKGKSIYSTAAILENLIKFLNWQTSTVAGERKHRETILNSLRNSENVNLNIDDEEAFLEFLESGAWEEYKYIDSREFLESADEIISKGGKVSDLVKLWETREERHKDAFELWDEWKKTTKRK